jgi:hypothetical protein
MALRIPTVTPHVVTLSVYSLTFPILAFRFGVVAYTKMVWDWAAGHSVLLAPILTQCCYAMRQSLALRRGRAPCCPPDRVHPPEAERSLFPARLRPWRTGLASGLLTEFATAP